MAIFKTSIAKLKEVQDQLREETQSDEPTLGNVEAATTFHDEGTLTYRGISYRTRCVPYRVGLRLLALDQEYRRVRAKPPDIGTMDHAIQVVRAMLDLFDSVIVRKWWQRRNPLLDAEEDEVDFMRHFFFTARTKFRASGVASNRAPAWLRQTWPTNLESLRVGIRAGSDQTAIPVAGDTISLDRSA